MQRSATRPDIQPPTEAIRSGFMVKVFLGFAALCAISVAISLGGHWFGRAIAMSGHTDDPTPHEIVIGNDVILAPANEIRFERARRDGVAKRLDLYLRWPDMAGYSEPAGDDFNHVGATKRILFLSLEPRMMSRDMSGRFEPIYRSLIAYPGTAGTGRVSMHEFRPDSGYLNEVLAVADREGTTPFVARCLSGDRAAESLAPCERDIEIGEGLSLSYRFPIQLLAEWQEVEKAVRVKAESLLETAR